MKIKKILHIQVIPKLSGVQKISWEILSKLPDSEYEKYILFSENIEKGDKEYCINYFESENIHVLFSKHLKREISFKEDFLAFIEIFQLCKKMKFDIVHTHSTKPGIIGRMAATFSRVPKVIHTVHGLPFYKGLNPIKWLFYRMCEFFASFFCTNIILVNKFYMKYFKHFKRKTSTIYNSIDFSKYKIIENNSNNNADYVHVLFVGRLDHQKDPITLLNAAKYVLQVNQNVIFDLVGDGSLYDQCMTFIKSNSMEKNVNILGWKNDIFEFYENADIFAMSSIYEAFGLVFLEAAFYGIPIVATNVEGIPEVVIEGKTGFLVDAKNPLALSEKILFLANDKCLRKKMGLENKTILAKRFNISTMVSEYRKIYEN